jgi:transcriptional regulator of arginine metabolism
MKIWGVFSLSRAAAQQRQRFDKSILHIYTSLLYFYTVRARRAAAIFFVLSKQERQNTIRQMIGAEAISSQDELRRKLVRRGFDVTQATLSRDIHELRLYKGPNGYAAPNGNGHVAVEEEEEPSVDEILSSFGLAVRQAQNQLVLRTTNGGAQPVALAIDHEDWNDVVGTLAGDDTVLIICPDAKRASALRERLERMIG